MQFEETFGSARARPINLSKLGQHQHKPPPVLLPIRPGYPPKEVPTGMLGAELGPAEGPKPEPAEMGASRLSFLASDDEAAGEGRSESDGEFVVGRRRNCRAVEEDLQEDGGLAMRPRSTRVRRVPAALADSPPAAAPTNAVLRLKNGINKLRKEEVQLLMAALKEAKAQLDSRFVIRRSGIAQLGVFAAAPIPPDTLLMEYYGEGVRSTVADLREKRYNAAGLGCYLFNPGGLPDEVVVLDATHRGNIMRFVNHSCGPNCVSRTVIIEGQKRIFLYSNTWIEPGTELTYDYKLSSALCLDMFKGLPEELLEQAAEEAGVELLRCQCGSKRCRKYL
ncbi:hypothetical protein GPECTOR_14g108 [Gonium pectorale]|uniref:SET domain-containing protein n=1 Tax=Gonium pectorale TaxID=33097 RepID=A0A150GLW8_GONPE|nr:hypothetical protein GPECTOR_14g108 [Gonium pectorale]|eukprot:KXZ50856.1 hypothetical protein GPECTOR_14g108 [Gonium pectorale]